MNLRQATREDAPAIAAIHRLAAFMPPAHAGQEGQRFVREQLMNENQVWVAEAAGEVAGYIAFNDDWVRHLFVHPHHQGQGIGQALLDRVIADGRERQLWTFHKNSRARKFYENRG
ncbi:GNAT family N-acetyltransferase, partial [Phenylobacterium sp.]|uniref:GNAT family N-acetyltransferase n=1 Tax=Phenylobacterium sp. TaxID=1871053 RepID=UPI002E326D60